MVLITRPEPGASDTARRLAAAGYLPVLAPMMTIARRTPELPSTIQAILVTSANALATAAALPHIPLLAVGDATAAQARAAGHTAVHSAGRDAAALADLAARLCTPTAGPLLLLSGAGMGKTLAADLRARGFPVVRRVTYAARPIRALPAAAHALLHGHGHALFFSPESARIFVRLFRHAVPMPSPLGWDALALSPPTADALAPLPWRRIRVASAPNQEALLALLP